MSYLIPAWWFSEYSSLLIFPNKECQLDGLSEADAAVPPAFPSFLPSINPPALLYHQSTFYQSLPLLRPACLKAPSLVTYLPSSLLFHPPFSPLSLLPRVVKFPGIMNLETFNGKFGNFLKFSRTLRIERKKRLSMAPLGFFVTDVIVASVDFSFRGAVSERL